MRTAAAAVAVALLAAAPAAAAPQAKVYVQYAAYGPAQLDVLPGAVVAWTNVSRRTHTVTADAGGFDSGELGPGRRFRVAFSRPGVYRYHCSIHPSILGEIDVRRVTLDALPAAAVPVGTPVELSGLAAPSTRAIRIERRLPDGTFAPVARTRPARDGTWRVAIRAAATGEYRVASGAARSEVRRLLVAARTVRIHATRGGVAVEVTPSAPYASILVEEYRRERFGWWPVAHRRLDYLSQAEIDVTRPARVRVVLVDRDGWTPLATSRVLTLPRR